MQTEQTYWNVQVKIYQKIFDGKKGKKMAEW